MDISKNELDRFCQVASSFNSPAEYAAHLLCVDQSSYPNRGRQVAAGVTLSGLMIGAGTTSAFAHDSPTATPYTVAETYTHDVQNLTAPTGTSFDAPETPRLQERTAFTTPREVVAEPISFVAPGQSAPAQDKIVLASVVKPIEETAQGMVFATTGDFTAAPRFSTDITVKQNSLEDRQTQINQQALEPIMAPMVEQSLPVKTTDEPLDLPNSPSQTSVPVVNKVQTPSQSLTAEPVSFITESDIRLSEVLDQGLSLIKKPLDFMTQAWNAGNSDKGADDMTGLPPAPTTGIVFEAANTAQFTLPAATDVVASPPTAPISPVIEDALAAPVAPAAPVAAPAPPQPTTKVLRGGNRIMNDLKAKHDNVSGKLGSDELTTIGPEYENHRLYPNAKLAFEELTQAFDLEFGKPIAMTDSYRPLDAQIAVRKNKPRLAAVPGTSLHGWGLAVDLGGGIQSFDTPEHKWMRANAPDYGWDLPKWARANGSKPEPWHWEYVGGEIKVFPDAPTPASTPPPAPIVTTGMNFSLDFTDVYTDPADGINILGPSVIDPDKVIEPPTQIDSAPAPITFGGEDMDQFTAPAASEEEAVAPPPQNTPPKAEEEPIAPAPVEPVPVEDAPVAPEAPADKIPDVAPENNDGHAREIYVVQFYVDQGLSAEGGAGFAGNFMQEAQGINPKANQDGGDDGQGIAQWSKNGRWQTLLKFAESRGLDPYHLDTQLQFSVVEAKRMGVWDKLAALKADSDSPSVEVAKQAAIIVEEEYEKPGKPHRDNRLKYTEDALGQWQNARN